MVSSYAHSGQGVNKKLVQKLVVELVKVKLFSASYQADVGGTTYIMVPAIYICHIANRV